MCSLTALTNQSTLPLWTLGETSLRVFLHMEARHRKWISGHARQSHSDTVPWTQCGWAGMARQGTCDSEDGGDLVQVYQEVRMFGSI